MKNILKLILIALAAGPLLFSCEKEFFESPDNVTSITFDTIFSSKEYAERTLFYAYSTLPVMYMTGEDGYEGGTTYEDLTDLANNELTWGLATDFYYSGTWGPDKADTEGWRALYNFTDNRGQWVGIRNTLILEENIHKVPDISEEEMKQMIAEGKAIRGLHFTHMFRLFGSVPFINTLSTFDDDFNVVGVDLARPDAADFVNDVAALLDEAIVDLPWVYADANNWQGRLTKAGAMAIKARLLLFAASSLMNDNEPYHPAAMGTDVERKIWFGGYDVEWWNKAKQAHEDLINAIAANGTYQLEQATSPTCTGYRAAYRKAYYKRESSEILVGVQPLYSNASNGAWSGFYGVLTFGSTRPNQNFIELFPMADGTPITESADYDEANPYGTYPGAAIPLDDFSRDPRLYENVYVNMTDFQGGRAAIHYGGHWYFPSYTPNTFSFNRKFFPEWGCMWDQGHVYPYLRLPEIYLGYAEILNHLNGGPTAEAYSYLNMVRNRVGLKNIEEVKSSWTEAEFLEELLNERAREFYMEEIRWYDLVRYKREDVFKKDLHKVVIHKDVNTQTGAVSYRHEYPLTEQTRYWKENFDPKWYLHPFPVSEVNKGYGLIQNPGW